ncbi:MAG: hypothetical protein K6E98_04985, partial [Lachnospiraceae bacterium]|nr:hypothetical protein [Lachnospiraceae bacterium]
MVIEYLCNVGYRSGHEIGAYLVGIQEDLNAIRNKKIYLFGAGENGFLAKTILQERGFKISGYVDNNVKMKGKHIGNLEIFPVKDLLDDTNAYFVICVSEKNIAGARLQLLVNRIRSFSIFVRMNGHSFMSEDIAL